jgi:hypothetical protein
LILVSFLAMFNVKTEGETQLSLIQNVETKFVELLSLPFSAAPQEFIQEKIAYRYNSIKARMLMFQGKLGEVMGLLKTKNPSLLLNLQKGSKAGMSVLGRSNQIGFSGTGSPMKTTANGTPNSSKYFKT